MDILHQPCTLSLYISRLLHQSGIMSKFSTVNLLNCAHYPSALHNPGSNNGQCSVGGVPDYMYIEIHKEQTILVFYTFLVCLYYFCLPLMIFKICKLIGPKSDPTFC